MTAARRTRLGDCHSHCHYCSMPLSPVRAHEHDHFPMPRHAGGRETVSACVNCHDLKDRVPIGQWDATLFVAGLLGLIGDQVPTGAEPADVLRSVDLQGDYRARWGQLSPGARLLYAKLRYLQASSDALTA